MSFRSVMLVDDNPFDNEIHRLALVRSGVVAGPDAVIVTEGGHEAEQRLRAGLASRDPSYPPSLILVDVHMPGMSGFDFVETLAGLSEDEHPGLRSSVVVMMLSTEVRPSDRARADALEIVRGYTQKPLTKARALELSARWGADGG